MKKGWKIAIAIIAVLLVVGGGIMFWQMNKDEISVAKKDYWKFEGNTASESWGGNGFFGALNSGLAFDSAAQSMSAATPNTGNLGFSVGGAKDVENFRENIEEGYFPISTDITYNGLFYDYSFDTGVGQETDQLFAPAYSTAISKDPVSEKEEYYMTVGLNSNIKESDFARKKLNLVVVLDISGSMSSGMAEYYYDNPFKETEYKSKMEVANEAVTILIDQLNDDDRFGMVLFDDQAYIGQEIYSIESTDVKALKDHILEIKESGGTNFEAGYTLANKLFEEYKDADSEEYENRIIVITDAMPNTGATSKESLMGMVKENSETGIYTTFIGVGVDFNTELIETISDNKGANYYSVHTAEEFKTRMGEEFDFMVTPMVFDLKLDLNSEDFEIEKVYGSDTANEETGNIMHVNTLFPSKTNADGEVKGGVVLLKLNKKTDSASGEVKLTVSYTDRNGASYENYQTIEFADGEERYDNTGIRKAIVLTRYVNTLKNWILYERTEDDKFLIIPSIGICNCDYDREEIFVILGQWERKSVKLTVSDEYKEIFNGLKTYITEQNNYMQDKTFDKEFEVLDMLIETK